MIEGNPFQNDQLKSKMSMGTNHVLDYLQKRLEICRADNPGFFRALEAEAAPVRKPAAQQSPQQSPQQPTRPALTQQSRQPAVVQPARPVRSSAPPGEMSLQPPVLCVDTVSYTHLTLPTTPYV
eukprot:TRINITY_DN8166_c0_g1_i2.p1 TRINITY_DN8166_c0_g1~~TRINITY_DN8166_c0_g1_i2.p1  ORF type:complete len:124 (-),score=19.63 TRINITY_DN8166_c0_g1_i2:2-373(-)